MARNYAWDVARTEEGLEDVCVTGRADPLLVSTVGLGRIAADSSRPIYRRQDINRGPTRQECCTSRRKSILGNVRPKICLLYTSPSPRDLH